MKNKLGIMLGRLSPPIEKNIQAFPKNSWKNEFFDAKTIGYDLIEWVFDTYQDNPIIQPSKIFEIKKISQTSDIFVNSVCADYFMKNKLFSVSENELVKNLQILQTLIEHCQKLEIEYVELPFVDSSSLGTENDKNEILINLEKTLSYAQNCNVKIGLETDLPPEEFKNLIEKFNHPNIVINYDIGNSTSNEFDPKLELELLHDWIENIHLKDRLKRGMTVSLGLGDTDFDLFFSALKKFGYDHDFIIQGAREDLDDSTIQPKTTCEKYFKFVNNFRKKYNFKSH